METFIQIFGTGNNLNASQMICRSIVVFLICLIMIRISGRRSFGIRTPLDNIIVMLLGTLLSRAIVGASPFWSVIAASFVVALLHRIVGRLVVQNKFFHKLIEGDKILLYHNGHYMEDNMKRGLVCKEDIIHGVRKFTHTENMDEVASVYIERNGEITVLKKDKRPD